MIVAATALIVALAGTAMAAPTAIKSILNKKEKKQAKNIAKNQISALAPTLSVKHANTAGSADTAKRADAATNADALGGVALKDVAVARSDPTTGGVCDPSSTTFVTCASVTLNAPHDGRVLLIGTAGQYSFDGSTSQGNCRMTVDGVAQGGSFVSVGNPAATTLSGASNRTYANGLATTFVTNPVGAGAHTFTLECNSVDSDVEFESAQISAALVGSGG
jgi:hypothetical protein